MPSFRVALAAALAVALLTLLAWLAVMQSRVGVTRASGSPTSGTARAIRLGIVPERDIFQQRKRFQALTKYMSEKLGQPIELATAAAYQDVLHDFANESLDGAFLGSFMTVLAVDRYDARPLVRPVMEGRSSEYRGVFIVPANSSVKVIEDLQGRSLAGVRATMAGHLYPFAELKQRNLLGPASGVRMVWVGTHDDVIQAVVDGRADAGAVKDIRLDAYEQENKGVGLRRLASSESVPENALVMRRDVSEQLATRVADLLLQMTQDQQGREVLKAFRADRFDPCRIEEYEAIFDMSDVLGSSWPLLGIDGPPPVRKSVGKG